jgi:wyosine [tRNA(Phe)-imidazoG37] synthetase (radical SAM superfamily)
LTAERREFFPRAEILSEVQRALVAHSQSGIDWLTLVGSGETTLYSEIGWLIRRIKRITEIPVAVITNGSLLYLPDVRQDLSAADVVLPSLDAGSEDLYRQINRHHSELSFYQLLNGLIAFRREQPPQIWIEIMLIRGMNDTEQALEDLAAALRAIKPDRVHLSLPTRPPSEPWVQAPDEEGLLRAMAILGESAQIVPPPADTYDLSGYENVSEAIEDIIARHPMREEELRRTLELWTPGQVEEALRALAAGGRAQVVERHGHRFWCAADYHYPE